MRKEPFMIRSLQRATKVPGAKPPYDTIHVRMYYPAVYPSDPFTKVTYQFHIDESKSPLTVVIFLPEVNVEASQYHWLGQELAKRGIMLVTTQWVAEKQNGSTELIPGAIALKPILELLETEQNAHKSILKGHLRMNCLVFGGHATGGSLALLRNDPELYERIAGAITYSALTETEYEERSQQLPDVPILIMEGTKGNRTIEETEQSFTKLVSNNKSEAYLLILQEADRMSVAQNPQSDDTPTEVRALIVDAIEAFIKHHILKLGDVNLWEQVHNNPLVKTVVQK